MTAPAGALGAARPGLFAGVGRAARQQAMVGAGQAAAGLGNLAFVAIAARVLDGPELGPLAAFVALHTAMHLPGAGLAALVALDPGRAARLERRSTAVGLVVGAVLALGSGPIASVTGLTTSMVAALAVSAPVAPLLGLRRGLAYARRDHGSVVLSLVSEPFGRCTLGLSLAVTAGAGAAVWGVVAGGWLAMLSLPRSTSLPPITGGDRLGRRAAWGSATAFVLGAVLQHQDVVVANRLLDGADAGAFAALSTVGGIVAFATATLPMVALPAAADGERGSSAVALGVALGIGGGATVLAAAVPDTLLGAVVGDGYPAAAPHLAPYVAAMAALGVTRVVAAHRCATGEARRVAITLAVVAAAHLTALVVVGRSVGAVVTTSAVALGVAMTAVAVPLRRPVPVSATARHAAATPGWRARARELDLPLLAGLAVVAAAIRFAHDRSLWIDEAISVAQARMPFGAMLAELSQTDVHPPLHHAVLWVTTRVLGTSEWALRVPSVLAGVLLVPAAYGLAREQFDRRTARVAAALVVPAPFLVWYAQEARMYSLFMLAGVCSVWAQAAALRRGTVAPHVAWGVASATMVWSQWFGVLPVAVQVVTGVVLILRRRDAGLRRPLLRLSGTVAVLVVAVAPLAPILLDQLASYGERGAGLSAPSVAGTDAAGGATEVITVYAVIANVVWALAGYHDDPVMAQLGALWPVAMFVALLGLGRRITPETKAVAAVAVVPALALLVVGTTKRDLFELRYFALLTPLLLVLLARATTTVARGRVALGAALVVLLAASTAGLVDQQLNGANPRLYDFRGAIEEIRAEAGDAALVAVEPAYLRTITDYYGPDLRVRPARGLGPDEVGPEGVDLLVAQRLVGSDQAASVVGDTLARLEADFGPPERIEHPNVVVWRFR